ncbi:hypothetical protein ACLOJK_029242, partial [Asimina triloba]
RPVTRTTAGGATVVGRGHRDGSCPATSRITHSKQEKHTKFGPSPQHRNLVLHLSHRLPSDDPFRRHTDPTIGSCQRTAAVSSSLAISSSSPALAITTIKDVGRQSADLDSGRPIDGGPSSTGQASSPSQAVKAARPLFRSAIAAKLPQLDLNLKGEAGQIGHGH